MNLHHQLTSLFTVCWNQGQIPDSWKHSRIVTIYKKKGDRSNCGNSRGISLLDVAGKILTRIMLHRFVRHIAQRVLPESQAGFRSERSTIDMIFIARQLLEKAREHQQETNFAFIDLIKAFDTVNRQMLWKLLDKFGCPPKFLTILRQFHEGMNAQVLVGGEASPSFPVSVGVKQGCVIAPVLFNVYLVAVTLLSRRTLDINDGVRVKYRLDGNLFNLRRLSAKTKTSTVVISELQFADDAAATSPSTLGLQRTVASLHTAYQCMGLEVNTTKTQTLQTAFHHRDPPTAILLDSTSLEAVNTFSYLGSILSNDASLDPEISKRISKASLAFGRLRERVFSNHHLKMSTKVSVYHAVCISTLLYGCEAWTPYRKHIKSLEAFHIRCLQRIMGITWEDKIPHTQILKSAGSSSVESFIIRRTLRWTGHVIRMQPNRLPRMVMYGELQDGRRPLGAPKKRWKDHLKRSLQACDITPANIEAEAFDRPNWRRIVSDGVRHFEAERNRMKEEHRLARHQRRLLPSVSSGSYPCGVCRKVCLSRIGLISHVGSHQRRGQRGGRAGRHRRVDGQP
jgi:hypothetical protein